MDDNGSEDNDKKYDKPIKGLEDAIGTIPRSKKIYVKTMEDDKVRSRQVLPDLARYGDEK